MGDGVPVDLKRENREKDPEEPVRLPWDHPAFGQDSGSTEACSTDRDVAGSLEKSEAITGHPPSSFARLPWVYNFPLCVVFCTGEKRKGYV